MTILFVKNLNWKLVFKIMFNKIKTEYSLCVKYLFEQIKYFLFLVIKMKSIFPQGRNHIC